MYAQRLFRRFETHTHNGRVSMATTKMALTASTFVSPSLQVLVSVGRDLKVDNGFKESSRLNVRMLKLF